VQYRVGNHRYLPQILSRLITFARGRSKPCDLPVQFAIEYKLTINPKIAKALAVELTHLAARTHVLGNREPFPDGAKMAKNSLNPKKQETYPCHPTVPGTQHEVDFMVRDSKRFADRRMGMGQVRL
jgi:hypothetical protein